jgi:hypothetical protein
VGAGFRADCGPIASAWDMAKHYPSDAD